MSIKIISMGNMEGRRNMEGMENREGLVNMEGRGNFQNLQNLRYFSLYTYDPNLFNII